MRVERSGIAEKFRKSGQTQNAFCKENRINIHTLRYYLYKKDNHRRSSNTVKKVMSPDLISGPFISFPGSPQNDLHQQRYPVTIINGHFTMKELQEFIVNTGCTGKTPC